MGLKYDQEWWYIYKGKLRQRQFDLCWECSFQFSFNLMAETLFFGYFCLQFPQANLWGVWKMVRYVDGLVGRRGVTIILADLLDLHF